MKNNDISCKEAKKIVKKRLWFAWILCVTVIAAEAIICRTFYGSYASLMLHVKYYIGGAVAATLIYFIYTRIFLKPQSGKSR